MNLLLDIGNTRIKWATQDQHHWFDGDALLHKGLVFSDVARKTWKDLDTPERVIVANVAGPEIEKKVTTWVKRKWKLRVEFLRAQADMCGVSNAYGQPERLGADRWASLLAAYVHYPGASIIVDCGTAITIDALAANGSHLGGLIIPGIDMMATALTDNAADIESDTLDSREVSLLGSSTGSAVTGGVLYAAIAFIDRVCADLQPELDDKVQLIVSGGDAARIMPLLSLQPQYDKSLVLKGLAVYAEEAVGCVT